jgi:uncharacterized membrane protein
VSLDLLRGLVIVFMVLDHVRDFLHAAHFDPLDPAHTTALLYATRWITHFCAPTFVFLAGTSAWLQRARGRDTRALSLLLLTRGLWLVLLELTVLGFGWSFAIPYLLFLQVIWAIGCSMVALAACVWLPRTAVLALGVLIVVAHDLLDPISPEQLGPYAKLWMALHVQGVWSHDGAPYALLAYPVLPWFGVMLLGYGMGPVFLMPARPRDRLLVTLGIAMIAAFLLLRYFNLYGDPQPWAAQVTLGKSLMAFLRVEKYPPSLFYVCATLGPVLALVPLLERWRGGAARCFMVFGSVPLFAYVVHVYLVHAGSIVLRVLTGQTLAGQFDTLRVEITQPAGMLLSASGYSLVVVYAAWIGVVLALYPLCRWFAGVKRRRRDWWLSYL